MITVLGIIVGLWLLTYGIPDLLWHHAQWGGFQGTRDSHRIALTFDDGPGADSPAILDALMEFGVCATFFLVLDHAERHPDIVQRMIQEGHGVGLHGVQHRSMYLLSPWGSWRAIRDGVRRLQAISGSRPVYYRPPWGHMNLVSWWACRHEKLTPVFWTIAPNDWDTRRDAQQIANHVTQLALPGAVVVLHDAGGDRQRTVDALKVAIPKLLKLNLMPALLSDIPRETSEWRRIWTWWETRFTKAWDVDTVASSLGGDPILRLGRQVYRGPSVRFGNGCVLSDKDMIAEIHFGNAALAQLSKTATGGLRAFHAVLRGLTDVAEVVINDPKYHDVQALGGITLLDASTAIEKLGFLRVPVRGWKKWSMWVYLTWLMTIYHADGWHTWRRFFKRQPVSLLMSRQELQTRYLHQH